MRESNHVLLQNSNNPELVENYKRHKELEKKVDAFSRHEIYSHSAAMKVKDLKKKKLLEMDRILKGLA